MIINLMRMKVTLADYVTTFHGPIVDTNPIQQILDEEDTNVFKALIEAAERVSRQNNLVGGN